MMYGEEAAPDFSLLLAIRPEQFPETREAEEAEYVEAAHQVAERGIQTVEGRFGTAENPREEFFYHQKDHSVRAAERAEIILRAMREGGMAIRETDIALARLIVSFHDSVQAWNPKMDWPEGSEDAIYGRILRVRHNEKNEDASAQEALQEMQAYNTTEGKPIFTQEDARCVIEGIRGTIPQWDQVMGTTVQPHVTEASSLIARAATLADLAEAGMATESFVDSGDRLFREENIDMVGLDVAALGENQKAYYKKRMLQWLRAQVKFAEGRRTLLRKETEGLPETVRALFTQFDQSIAFSQARADMAEDKSFEEVYREMGF